MHSIGTLGAPCFPEVSPFNYLVFLRNLVAPADLHPKEKSTKLGVKNKRLKSGWDDDFRLKVLLG